MFFNKFSDINLSMLNVEEGLIFKEKKNDSELNLSPNLTDKKSQRQAADAPTKANLSRIWKITNDDAETKNL